MTRSDRLASATLCLVSLLGALGLLLAPPVPSYLPLELVTAAAFAAVLYGRFAHRPADARVFSLLATAIGLSGVGAGLTQGLHIGASGDGIAAVLADAAFLVGSGCLFWALLRLQSAVGDERGRDRLIDAAVVVLGLGWVAVLVVSVPVLGRDQLPYLPIGTTAGVPVLNLLALVGGVRVLRSTDRCSAALSLLLASLVASLASNVALPIASYLHPHAESSPAELGWMASSTLIGLTAVNPGLGLVRETRTRAVLRFRRVRATVLGAALASGPLTESIRLARTASWSLALGLAVPTVAIIALAITRVRWAFRAAESSRAEIERRERYFRAIVERLSDHLVVLGGDALPRYASPGLLELVGMPLQRLVDRHRRPRFIIEEDLPRVDAAVARAVLEPGTAVQTDVRLRDAKGALHHCVGIATSLLDDPAVGGVVVVLRDVTESKLLEEQLRHQALHDALTGLPNRALIHDRLAQMSARARRRHGSVAVLLVDLDAFKDINDTFGHGVGDELLRAVADRLALAMQEGDTIGRTGGDEFVILSEVTEGGDGPEALAERALQILAEPFDLDGAGESTVRVSASIGISEGRYASPESLMRDADVALHRAKATGRGRYVVFKPEMYDALEERLLLELDLHDALERGEFFARYQPTFELGSLTMVGVEALLRWQHPGRGLLTPDRFLPMLEETGLITSVGAWILRAACEQAAGWALDGMPLQVGVNVSARQLDDAFPALVRTVLQDTGVDPHLLVLEITESVLLRDGEAERRRLAALHELGVRIAIDDFGMGYSSFGYLQHLPIDVLKIDRSFVSGMARGNHSATLVRTLVRLGKELGLETVAEGVESEEQLGLLRSAGCDSGQGFLFAPPLPPSEVELAARWRLARAPEPATSRRETLDRAYAPGLPLIVRRNA